MGVFMKNKKKFPQKSYNKLDKQPFEINNVKMITYNGGFFDWVSKTSFFIKRIL